MSLLFFRMQRDTWQLLKASPPARETQEFHQGSHIWKQQFFIPCIHIQAPNVLNSQTSYRN